MIFFHQLKELDLNHFIEMFSQINYHKYHIFNKIYKSVECLTIRGKYYPIINVSQDNEFHNIYYAINKR